MSAREEIEKIIDKKYMNRLKSKNNHRKEKTAAIPQLLPGKIYRISGSFFTHLLKTNGAATI